jgi:hypothetical protein
MKTAGLLDHEDEDFFETSATVYQSTRRNNPNNSIISQATFLRPTLIQTHSQFSVSTLSKVFRPLIFCMHAYLKAFQPYAHLIAAC